MNVLTTANSKYQKPSAKQIRPYASWRFWVIYGFIALALLALVGKFAHLQLVEQQDLVKQSDIRSLRTLPLDVHRGLITDRTGRALAVSVPVAAVWIDPKKLLEEEGIIDSDMRWQALADVLELSLPELVQRVNSNPKSRFMYLARQVTPEVADYIKQLKLPHVGFEKESRRYYPTGEISAHLIGFTDIDGKGIEGVENSFNAWLIGKSGEKTVRRDRFGRLIENINSVESEEAKTLTLSIDERLQTLLYKELSDAVTFNKAESGSAVLIDIETGEILALANSPSYNPNNRFGVSNETMRNRAITDVFEPGSTVKPIVVMAALDKKIVKKNAVINTKPFSVNGHLVRDVSYQNELSLEGILQKSSNVGVSRLAMQMDPKELVNIYSKFGFGQPTEIGLVGESKGYNPESKRRWSDIERATYSFGYGLTATPLQLAKVYATIGGFGVSRPVSILRVNEPTKGERIFPEQTARSVVKMMESVAAAGGGGVKASVEGYRVAVKTGTAKKVGENGKYINEYIAYTAGIAPASKPRFSLAIVINSPKAGKYYGGAVSAPVFGNIMGGVLRAMNIEPDAYPNNSIVINR